MKAYRHPPIVEAVIELRSDIDASQKDQERVLRRLAKDYPHSQSLSELSVRFDQPTGGVTVTQELHGFRLSSEDQADLVTVQANAVAVSRLAPYIGWSNLYDRAFAAWKVRKRFIKNSIVQRIGVRYINRIDIPYENRDGIALQEYLKFHPSVPEIGDSPTTTYLIQITKATDNPLWSATITSTKIPSPLVDHASVLLDIDVFRTEQIPLKDTDLCTMVNEAREIKNMVFKRCITHKAEELFNR